MWHVRAEGPWGQREGAGREEAKGGQGVRTGPADQPAHEKEFSLYSMCGGKPVDDI